MSNRKLSYRVSRFGNDASKLVRAFVVRSLTKFMFRMMHCKNQTTPPIKRAANVQAGESVRAEC